MAKRILQTLNLVEDEHYNRHLVRAEYKTCETETFGLYKVQFFNDKIVYVMAESESGAISQATSGECRGQGDSYSEERDLEKGAMAIRIKFKIRGWGGELF